MWLEQLHRDRWELNKKMGNQQGQELQPAMAKYRGKDGQPQTCSAHTHGGGAWGSFPTPQKAVVPPCYTSAQLSWKSESKIIWLFSFIYFCIIIVIICKDLNRGSVWEGLYPSNTQPCPAALSAFCLHNETSSSQFKHPPKHPHSPQESRAPCFVLPPSAQGHSKHCTLFEMEQRTVKQDFVTRASPLGEGMRTNSHVVWHTGARYSDTACDAWAPPNPRAPSHRARGPWLRLWCDSSQRCLGLQGWCLSSISWTRKVWFSNIAVSAQVAGWPPWGLVSPSKQGKQAISGTSARTSAFFPLELVAKVYRWGRKSGGG